jgi:23S rRNA pseudouridine1911/1915/1917 synthase
MTDHAGEIPGRPVLDWIQLRYPDTPRKRAKQWILAGRVSVNGRVIRQPHQVILDPGDALVLRGRGSAFTSDRPWRIHPQVTLRHLDGALAVVDKGAGLVSVPAPHTKISALGILADFLAGSTKTGPGGRDQAGRTLPSAYRRLQPLPVHRLDQYTSGIFCVALNPQARRHLIAQLHARTLKREYIAYAEGRPDRPQGTWRHWLRRSADQRRQEVLPAAEVRGASRDVAEAVTHYEVIEEFPLPGASGVVTKLRLRLETGCRHQIRIQAAAAGLPLVGDRTYQPECRGESPRSRITRFGRQALHAEILELEHPEQRGTRYRWTAALPEDLQQLEAALRRCVIS